VDVAIIGGGIMGLALAWNLAGRGAGRILVLERGYLCEGASGRNGGGVRAQWTTPTLIELAKESIEFMGRFAQELGINVWLRKGGYLFLAHDQETLRRIEYGADLQKRYGLPTRVIGPGEAGEIVPQLDTSKFIAASWNPEDGVVFPWPFLWGYADGARKRGALVEPFTRASGIEVSEGRVRAVQTDRGRVAADRVVIAAGAWSPTVARLAGLELPNVPYRHEIVSSEPLKPFLGPLVSMLAPACTLAVDARRDRGRHGRSRGAARLEPDLVAAVHGALRQGARRFGATGPSGEAAAPVGRLLRRHARPLTGPGRDPGRGRPAPDERIRRHGFMMAPAVGRRMAEWMAGPRTRSSSATISAASRKAA